MILTMNQENTDIKTVRVYGLDVIRAFAIIFVLIGHSFEHSKIAPEIQVFGRLGILGVELFFVLSGYLIGTIIMRLIDEGRLHSISDINEFWKRRWLRTLPLYFVVLLAFLRFDYHGRHELLDFPDYFVFMQNFAYKIPEFFELSWSLAIEEHFYLWFPIAFFVLERITKRARLAIVLAAVSFLIVAYTFRLSHPQFQDWNEYNRTIRLTVLSRIDAIMFGVLMAAIKRYWGFGFEWIRRGTAITAVLLVLLCTWWFVNAPYLMQSRALQINLYTVQAVLCALLLPWFDALRSINARGGFIVLTSKLSYSLYLVHILVIIAVNRLLSHLGLFDQVYGNPFILYPLYFVFFYFVSWVTYHQIEEPFLRLRDVPKTWQNIAKGSWVFVLACVLLATVF
ncbi:O-acetyltransferase OatA [Azoarcus sp. Aa7]|nr:O-acetyltransferase OatA [Azoarcus sp. Aa7]